MLSMKGIDSIFQKEKGQYYKNKARFYQDILIFASMLPENEPFKLWKLATFLRQENEEFRNRNVGSKKKDANKMQEYIQRRIKRNVDDLVNLRLIVQAGEEKEERGTALIPTFRYTSFGYFLSRIIQCLRSDKDAESELYDLFLRMYNVLPDSPSFTILASKLTKKMHGKGVFANYVSILKEVFDSKSIKDITSFAGLLQNTVNLRFHNPANGLIFLDTWEEAIDELDPDTRKLYLYDQKLDYDQKMGKKAITKEYEMLRYDLRQDPEVIALEGYCYECKRRAVIHMKILQYNRRLANAHTWLDGRAFTCPKCNAPERTLLLPNLWE
jgi:hypothetical protein